MGRPKNREETAADAFDKIFAEIDPEVLLAGALGAVAAAGGITPPFTALLAAIPNGSKVAFDVWKAVASIGSAPLAIADYLGWLKGPSGAALPPETYALAASGALEAMMMMSLVKNPATITAIGNAVGGAASATKALL